jgi:aminoglycoside phosphotransferase (APT) family kinase protein
MSGSFADTTPVREAHRFDTERLAEYLRQHVDDFAGPIDVAQFKGGQSNPTYLVRAGSKSYVLRRKPPAKLLPSAHAVDREYRVIMALAATDVPVAKTYTLCMDEAVMHGVLPRDYVEGRILGFSLPDDAGSARGVLR